MAQLSIGEDIHPISELKSKAGEIVLQASRTGRPIVLTRHGRGVAVLLSVEEYERLYRAANHEALLAALQQGEDDFDEGRVLSHETLRTKWTGEGHGEA